MALLCAAASSSELVVCRTFAERTDRPDFLGAARLSRSLSDSFILSRVADTHEADCKTKVLDISDVETDLGSRCSCPSQGAESDSESLESVRRASAAAVAPPRDVQWHLQSAATCWVALPMTVADVHSSPPLCAPVASSLAEPSKRIFPRPVKRTQDVENGVQKTTVMLRNMPIHYNRALLLELLDREGFCNQYDFVYLPMNPVGFESRACRGFAFINLLDPATALRFFRTFEGYASWAVPSRKVGGVSWHDAQGLSTLVDRYRNSSIMKASVPDEYKPVVFASGIRASFPAPTGEARRS